MKRTETFVDAFTQILLRQHCLKRDEALAIKKIFFDRSQEAFDDFLLQEGLISRTEILNALSTYYQVPSFDVIGYFFEYRLLHEFPKDFLLRHEIIPLEREEDTLFVVASHPNDANLLAQIGEYVSYDIQFLVGIARDITDAVKEFYDKSPTEVLMDQDLDEEERLDREAAQELGYGELFLEDEE